MSLNRRQLTWLRLHAAEPAPHRWAWVDKAGRREGPMDDKNYLRAWRRPARSLRDPFVRMQQATIHKDDRAGLEPFMNSLTINDAGRALLETLK